MQCLHWVYCTSSHQNGTNTHKTSQSQKYITFLARDLHSTLLTDISFMSERLSLSPADPRHRWHGAQSWFTGSVWSHTHAHTGLGSNPSLNPSPCLPRCFPSVWKDNTKKCGLSSWKNMMPNHQQIWQGGWTLSFLNFKWHVGGRWLTAGGKSVVLV